MMTPRPTLPRLALSSALLAAALASGTLLSGCATPPAYEKPGIVIPAVFKESALWKAARPEAASVPDDWWQLFNDPVLNGLQQQLVIGNENLKASVAQYRVARAALASSSAATSPSLGLSAGVTQSVSTVVTTPTTSNSLSLNAGWELDLWGRLSGAVSAAEARLQASSADLAAARLSAQALLTQSYFSLRSAEAQADLLERSVGAYQRSLQLTQNRYAGGVASAADVAQATTQLRSTQAQLVDSTASRALLEHAIATLLGKPAAAFSLPRTAQLPVAPAAPVQLPASLLERRPDIAAAERRVAAANAQLGVAQSAFFPSLNLSASAGYRGPDLANLLNAPNLFWSLGPALALTLFDGGVRQATQDSARASMDQAAAVYRQTVLVALQEVEDNLVSAASLQEQATLQADAHDAAQRNLDITNNQYKAGTVSYLNVVTAQTTALAAERTLLDVRNRRLAATATLLKNLGGRWDASQAVAPAAR
jgi:NodT family efflux transporter outer membrane factor (OMF) lipoprotein